MLEAGLSDTIFEINPVNTKLAMRDYWTGGTIREAGILERIRQ